MVDVCPTSSLAHLFQALGHDGLGANIDIFPSHFLPGSFLFFSFSLFFSVSIGVLLLLLLFLFLNYNIIVPVSVSPHFYRRINDLSVYFAWRLIWHKRYLLL